MAKPIQILLLVTFTLIVFKASSSMNTNSASIDIKGPLQLEASYVADIYGNFTGGLKTGFGYLGMANLRIGFDTQKAHLWKGGQFFINGASTHGKSPTENYIGDFQVVSNIDAGDLIYLHELWFNQTFGNFEFTAGLQDMNATFVSSENGAFFLNSSFGIPPVISDNVPVPIFPLTGLGISALWKISDHLSWLAAAFDGSPTDFENNPYNIRWDWDVDDGLFLITELQLSTSLLGHGGLVKGGSYFHTGSYEDDEIGLKSQTINKNYGFYVLCDQPLWTIEEDRHLDFFSQVAWSSGEVNTHNYYVGGGFNFHGLLKSNHNNMLGIGVAHAGFHRSFHKHETVIETFFNYQLNDYVYLQPDLQFIINPAGSEEKLNNAMICFLRVGIQF